MSKRNSEGKSAKGEFEEFRSGWLLQVAADRAAKAAAPAAMVLACQYLNRGSGKAWPGINSLKERTGAASTNTIRSALKLLEERGHATIEWSDGGKNKTHIVIPLVNGKPFRKLKGMGDRNPSTSDPETLQVSDAKPFKKLNPNHLREPLDIQGAAQAAPPEDRDNNSSRDALGLRRASPTGEDEPPSFAGVIEDQPEWLDEAPMPNSLDEYGGHVIAANSSFADDDEGGIPYDGKSADRPEAQSADPRERRGRDLLTRCLRREPELTADERQRVYDIFARSRSRSGSPIAGADFEALTTILARLEGGSEFADDLNTVETDLSEPAAERVMMEDYQ